MTTQIAPWACDRCLRLSYLDIPSGSWVVVHEPWCSANGPLVGIMCVAGNHLECRFEDCRCTGCSPHVEIREVMVGPRPSMLRRRSSGDVNNETMWGSKAGW